MAPQNNFSCYVVSRSIWDWNFCTCDVLLNIYSVVTRWLPIPVAAGMDVSLLLSAECCPEKPYRVWSWSMDNEEALAHQGLLGHGGGKKSLCSSLVCIVVVVLCVLLSSYVYMLYYVCTAVFTLDAGLLARSQYSEGPATGHLDTDFSWFPYVYKQMLRWFPRLQLATTCFSYSPSDLNLVVTNFIFCIYVK